MHGPCVEISSFMRLGGHLSNEKEIRILVRDRYGEIASSSERCCSSCSCQAGPTKRVRFRDVAAVAVAVAKHSFDEDGMTEALRGKIINTQIRAYKCQPEK